MKIISDICAGLVTTCVLLLLPSLVAFVVLLIKKSKHKRKLGFITLGIFLSVIVFSIIGAFTDPATYCKHQWTTIEKVEATCTENGKETKECSICKKTETKKEKKLGHSMKEVEKVEATYESEGKIVNKCERCDFSETEIIPQLIKAPSPSETKATSNESSKDTNSGSKEKETKVTEQNPPSTTQEQPKEDYETVSINELYKEFKSNQIRACDNYGGHRLKVTATVNGIGSGSGLLNFNKDIHLTMEIRVDNTIAFFYATFPKEQKDSIKLINKGDEITFVGTFGTESFSFDDCVILN